LRRVPAPKIIGHFGALAYHAPIKETTRLTDLPSLPIDVTLPIIQGYTSFTSTTSIHWCLHWHTSCHWLEAPTGPSTENLPSTGGRQFKLWVYPSVPVNLQPWTARGDHYDPQPVKCSSEWVCSP